MIQSNSHTISPTSAPSPSPTKDGAQVQPEPPQHEKEGTQVTLSEEARQLNTTPGQNAERKSPTDPSMMAVLWSKKVWKSNPSGTPQSQEAASDIAEKPPIQKPFKALKPMGGEAQAESRQKRAAPEPSDAERRVEGTRKRLQTYKGIAGDAETPEVREAKASGNEDEARTEAGTAERPDAIVVSTLRGRGSRATRLGGRQS